MIPVKKHGLFYCKSKVCAWW